MTKTSTLCGGEVYEVGCGYGNGSNGVLNITGVQMVFTEPEFIVPDECWSGAICDLTLSKSTFPAFCVEKNISLVECRMTTIFFWNRTKAFP